MTVYIKNIQNPKRSHAGGISCSVTNETEKAYLLSDDYGNEEWVAKSILEEYDTSEQETSVTVPNWFIYQTTLGKRSEADWVNKMVYSK